MVVAAEGTALLKEHKALPSATEFATSVGSQALFGAAFAGMSYGINHIAGSAAKPTTTDSGNAKITTYNDAKGQPLKFAAEVPSFEDPKYTNVLWNSTKMTDDTWKSSGNAVNKGTVNWASDAYFNDISSITRATDGTVVLNDTNGNVRTFAPGQYTRANPTAEAADAAREYSYKYFDRTSSNGDHEVSTPENGYRNFDAKGQLKSLQDKPFGSTSAHIHYDPNGEMSWVSVADDNAQASLHRVDNNTWSLMKGEDQYTWKGDIQQVKGPSGQVDSLTFTPENGKTQTFTTAGGAEQIKAAIDASSQYKGLGQGLPSAKVGPHGEVVLSPGTDTHLTVNGKEVTGETAIKPEDQVHVNVNLGLDWNDWQDRQIKMGKAADGNVTLNGQPIGPHASNLYRIATAADHK